MGRTYEKNNSIKKNYNMKTLKKYEDFVKESVGELEDSFIDVCFDNADIEGLTGDEVKEYIRYIADRRLLGLGMKAIFHSTENPLPMEIIREKYGS